jgi:stage V sporulation protein AB
MWQQLFLGIIGLCGGIIVAGGVVGLMICLSIIPRYAGITHTAGQLLLYEDSMLLGSVLGNVFWLYRMTLPLGRLFLIFYGLFSGMFLGGWILALEELADILPIFSRRIKLKEGIPQVIVSIALGKTIGCYLYYYLGLSFSR